MAEPITLTDEQQQRVQSLLEELDQAPQEVFFPMAEKYNQDIRPYLSDEELQSLNDSATDQAATTSTDDITETDSQDTAGDDLANPDTGFDDSFQLNTDSDSADTADLDSLADFGTDIADSNDTDLTGSFDDLGGLSDFGDMGETISDGDEPGVSDITDDATANIDDSIDLGDLADLGNTSDTDTGDLNDFGDINNGVSDIGDLGDFGDISDDTAAGTDSGSDFGDLANLGDFGDIGNDITTSTDTDDGLGDLGGLGDFGDIGDDDTSFQADTDSGLDLGSFDTTGSGQDTDIADFGDLGELSSIDDSPLPAQDFDSADDSSILGDAEFPVFDTSDFESPGLDGGDFAGDTLGLDTADLADMSQTAMMSTGIGDEFTDEELAKLRTQLLDYPPGIRKAVIDAIVNEKISVTDQRLLTHMLVEQANEDAVASFLEEHLGYRPDTSLPDRTRDGIAILYTDDVTPEALQRRRRRAMWVIGSVAGIFLSVAIAFGSFYLWRSHSIAGVYEKGLAELAAAENENPDQKLSRRSAAEAYYQKALQADNGRLSLDYMTKYGLAYMKAGFYDDAFVKLFGKVEPEYDWTAGTMRAPLIRLVDGSKWAGAGNTQFLAADNRIRKLVEPGAYTVSKLRDSKMNRDNLMALARFHSGIAYSFIHSDEGKKYKNDSLAIDYYKLILTLLDMPSDGEAMAGIGRIYYHRGEYSAAASEYQKIVDQNPGEVLGHSGLLETYIEIWRQNQDPRFVIEKHRQIQRLGLEKKMPVFVLSKLAGFYIDLNKDDLRIRYQIDPVDAMSGLDLDDNAINLLGIVFDASEKRDDQEIDGSTYATGYYERGRYLNVKKEYKRAVKQFQNTFQYDPKFYPALNEIGSYYARILDFDRAKEYYLQSIKSYEDHFQSYGVRPEDEILAQYDRGLIYFNLASLVFHRYAGIEQKDVPFVNRIYPQSAAHDESQDDTDRRNRLYEAGTYLDKALELNLKDKQARQEAMFWLGWIPYIQGDFKESLRRWSDLDNESEDSFANTNLNFGKANAAFHTGQYLTARGYYLKLRDELEILLRNSSPQDDRQKMAYYLLYSVYNNLGAVYEAEYLEKLDHRSSKRELDELQTKGLTHYMKAVELARMAEFIPEKAMANRELAFRNVVDRSPMIEDWLNPILQTK